MMIYNNISFSQRCALKYNMIKRIQKMRWLWLVIKMKMIIIIKKEMGKNWVHISLNYTIC